MVARRTAEVFGLSVLMIVLATSAFAQFDAQHDHLKCYKIKGGAIVTKVQTDNQFGREMIFKLVPEFLCAPTQKTCLATDGSCGKPGAPAGTPVQHFKCYKVAAKQCPNDNCTKLTGHFASVPAELIDQFGDEHVTVSVPKMLCTPVEKIVGATTTTSPPTTTTTQCVPPSCPTTTTTTATSTTTTTIVCPTGQTLCAGRCVDTSSDPNNCGACGSTCRTGAGFVCTAGVCACPSADTLCGTRCSVRPCHCADLQTDPNNCGSCGNVCPAGATCSGGVCACPAGETLCGSPGAFHCADLTSDGNNCGACGTVCTVDTICHAGVCVVACGADFGLASGACPVGEVCRRENTIPATFGCFPCLPSGAACMTAISCCSEQPCNTAGACP